MSKKRTLNEIRQTKDSVYRAPKSHKLITVNTNVEQIPEGWWLNITPLARLDPEEWIVGVLKKGRKQLDLEHDASVRIIPVTRPRSIELIKKRLNGVELSTEEINILTDEITNHRLSDVELSAFVCSTYMNPLNNREITDLTMAMVNSGEIIDIDVDTTSNIIVGITKFKKYRLNVLRFIQSISKILKGWNYFFHV